MGGNARYEEKASNFIFMRMLHEGGSVQYWGENRSKRREKSLAASDSFRGEKEGGERDSETKKKGNLEHTTKKSWRRKTTPAQNRRCLAPEPLPVMKTMLVTLVTLRG